MDTLTGEVIRDAAPLPAGNSRNIDGICGTATRADGGMVVVYAGGVNRPTAAPITLYQFAQQESFIYDVEGDIWTPGEGNSSSFFFFCYRNNNSNKSSSCSSSSSSTSNNKGTS